MGKLVKSSSKKVYNKIMDSETNFDEVELNYLLQALEFFREHGVSELGPNYRSHLTVLKQLSRKIHDALNTEEQ
jgi:hypothetical protein